MRRPCNPAQIGERVDPRKPLRAGGGASGPRMRGQPNGLARRYATMSTLFFAVRIPCRPGAGRSRS